MASFEDPGDEVAADGGLEDVVVTLSRHYHLIRRFSPAPRLRFLLLVVLDRTQANLAMALRELRGVDPDAVRPEPALSGRPQGV